MNRDLPQTIILPAKGWRLPDFREVAAHRDLLWFFIVRDVKVRYRQTALGVLWAVLQPLLTLAIMSLVFGRVLGLSSEGVPYPLFCFAGLVLWQYFSQAVSAASSSVVNHTQLIEKVYLPRVIIPLSAVFSGLLNLAISLILLLLLMLVLGVVPGPMALLCIPIAILTSLFAASVGLVLAAFSVRFRDVNYLVPIIVQLWMFASPVIYAFSAVPKAWRPLFALNPLSGFIAMFRSALLGTAVDATMPFAVGCLLTLLALPLSMLIFRRLEQDFADVI